MKKNNSLKLPNFLIVGAAKSGTTSLYEYLKQHPDIYMPEWKEPSFFVSDPYFNLRRVKTMKLYHALFAKAAHKAIGEASVAYLFDEKSAGIIKRILGDIKILIILRDPVAMAYSLYNQKLRKEGETLSSFEEALIAEEARRRDIKFRKKCYGYHATYYYYNFALYYQQVARYFKTFTTDNIKVFLYDDLKENPLSVVKEAYRFLGVDDCFIPEIKIHNQAGAVFSMPLFWKDYGLWSKTVQFLFSKNSIRKIPHLIRNIGRKPPGQIKSATARQLRSRFYEDICKLEALIGRDLSKWKA